MNAPIADVIAQSIIDNTVRLVFDGVAFGVGFWIGKYRRPPNGPGHNPDSGPILGA
ncbi:hypothetical protein [Rhodococcus sp. 14-2470-1a]|uniref:hypothetical protein n=1 Tax=Rhodococcus sp. 14-2470-1a TaxID=2023150 RepID=UPI0015C597A1|nr:hypothetical protein [Rhodococcus sp. 14-2470-1a]